MEEREGHVYVKAGAATAFASVGAVRVEITKGLPWAADGFRAAAARYRVAEQAGDVDGVAHALFEATSWLDSLAEQDPALNGVATIRATTFARARSHHHLASVIELPEGASGWRWRQPQTFPADPRFADRPGENVYRAELAGRPVSATLARIEAAVARRYPLAATAS